MSDTPRERMMQKRDELLRELRALENKLKGFEWAMKAIAETDR